MSGPISPRYSQYQGVLITSLLGSLLCFRIDAFLVQHSTSSRRPQSPRSEIILTRDRHHLSHQQNSSNFRKRQGRNFDATLYASTEDIQHEDATKEMEANRSQPSSFWTGTNYARPLHDSAYTQVLSTVLPTLGAQLRQEYDDHFADPRQPDASRFSWDPWFVSVGDIGTKPTSADFPAQDVDTEVDVGSADSGNDIEELLLVPGELEARAKQTQYSLKRIQTSQFFSPESYDYLLEELMALGRSVGLHAITPPWTSMYTDGDQQNWHSDTSNGPLAFVLSLCADEGDFEGGETILLQPQMLDFWRGFDSSRGIECGSILRHIPPFPLGRCIAFDPRVPHGVNRVTGNGHNPRRARVVVHGWFNDPQTTWMGAWNEKVDDGDVEDEEVPEDAAILLDQVLQPLVSTLASGEIGRVVGYLAVQMNIRSDGSVEDVRAVCDTLRADPEDFRGVIGYDEADRPVMEDAVADVRLSIFETLKDLYFGESRGERAVIIPFDFE